MAANLDKAESSLTAVSDIAYIRGIDSSGNSVRISKADLASVLGVKRFDMTHTGRTELYKLSFDYYNPTSQNYSYCLLIVMNLSGYAYGLAVAQNKQESKIAFGTVSDTKAFRDNDGEIYIQTGGYVPFDVYGLRLKNLTYAKVTDSVSVDTLTQIT